jgi:hypothetical protein
LANVTTLPAGAATAVAIQTLCPVGEAAFRMGVQTFPAVSLIEVVVPELETKSHMATSWFPALFG